MTSKRMTIEQYFASVETSVFSPSQLPSADRPILAVVTNGHGRPITFFRNPDDEIVISPWGLDHNAGDTIATRTLSKSDLFALRAFLDELPDEAFEEPAPKWQKGDIVVQVSQVNSTTYVRKSDGTWDKYRNGSLWSRDGAYDDSIVQTMLNAGTHRAVRQLGEYV